MRISDTSKNLLMLLPLSAAVASLAVSPNGQALAAGATCGTAGNYFDASQNAYSPDTYGVKADIERQEPALCSSTGGSPSISTVWAMLVPHTPSTQYAQAGYIKVGTNNPAWGSGHPGMHNVTQYTTQNGSPMTAWGADPPSGSSTYKVFYRVSDHRIHMLVNNTELDVIGRDIRDEWSLDWAGQFSGETYHKQSDVPGSDTNHVTFDNLQTYDQYLATTCISTVTLYDPDNANYKHSRPAGCGGGTAYDVWTVGQ